MIHPLRNNNSALKFSLKICEKINQRDTFDVVLPNLEPDTIQSISHRNR